MGGAPEPLTLVAITLTRADGTLIN